MIDPEKTDRRRSRGRRPRWREGRFGPSARTPGWQPGEPWAEHRLEGAEAAAAAESDSRVSGGGRRPATAAAPNLL